MMTQLSYPYSYGDSGPTISFFETKEFKTGLVIGVVLFRVSAGPAFAKNLNGAAELVKEGDYGYGPSLFFTILLISFIVSLSVSY
jgi:hypothetical protein